MSLLAYLGFGKPDPDSDARASGTAAVRKIIEALEKLDRERARYLAAFAYILGRVAYADREVSKAETTAMERIVMEQGQLPEEQAAIVIQMAKTQNLLFGGTEDFLVTREFNLIASHEQKMTLLACLFAVSAADDSITTVEDNEIRRVAVELRIEHPDYIAVRSRYRGQLSVLKDRGK